ncbi:CC/Se motif family (seleno)protein [Desulfosporosinus sp. PR]|nr:CC/Se motif family (seleno)protein [Desulfosporosinus sp. PR]
MRIKITHKAKEFLQKSGKTELYIERFDDSQCCIPLTISPAVRKGKPPKPEKFNIHTADEFTVYYDRSLACKDELTIDSQGIGIVKGLIISDWA